MLSKQESLRPCVAAPQQHVTSLQHLYIALHYTCKSEAGFQISLNYLIKFNPKCIPNSSRALLFLGGTCCVRPALPQDLCMFSSCLLLPGPCKAFFSVFLFWEEAAGCDLPCARTLCMFPGVCYFLACAKRVALFFWEEVAKCDLPCAKQVAFFLWVARLPTLWE